MKRYERKWKHICLKRQTNARKKAEAHREHTAQQNEPNRHDASASTSSASSYMGI